MVKQHIKILILSILSSTLSFSVSASIIVNSSDLYTLARDVGDYRPVDGVPTPFVHFHTDGNSLQTGAWDNGFELLKGFSEFTISSVSNQSSAFLTFDVLKLGEGDDGSLRDTVSIFSYNPLEKREPSWAIKDPREINYNRKKVDINASFDTSKLGLGDTVSVDVTSALNSAINNGDSLLGLTFGRNNARSKGNITFNNFRLTTEDQTSTASTPTIRAEISFTEYSALISLYNSTNGYNWTNNLGWGGEWNTACSWKGITCKDNAVIKIDLSENQLVGNISPRLGQLSQLTELILYGNQLTDNIPPELGQLSNLSILGLATNQLTGNIPSALGQLSQLKKLFLHENQLAGTIPVNLGQLSQLTWLSLSTNQLTSNITPELGNLSELRDLYLQENNLTGNIPSELGQLSKLETLNLENNCLTTDGSTPASFLDSINTSLWRNQDTNCSTPLPLQQQAVSLYDDNTGVLIIKDVAVNGENYSAELKDQGGFQFLLTKTTLLSKSVHNTPANYSADTGLVNIPSVFALGRLYTVQLKNNGAGVFSLTKAE